MLKKYNNRVRDYYEELKGIDDVLTTIKIIKEDHELHNEIDQLCNNCGEKVLPDDACVIDYDVLKKAEKYITDYKNQLLEELVI